MAWAGRDRSWWSGMLLLGRQAGIKPDEQSRLAHGCHGQGTRGGDGAGVGVHLPTALPVELSRGPTHLPGTPAAPAAVTVAPDRCQDAKHIIPPRFGEI